MASSGRRDHTSTYPLAVPRSGPSAYFGHQVLISKHSEVLISHDKCQSSKLVPAKVAQHHQQFVLPSSPTQQSKEKLLFPQLSARGSSNKALASGAAGAPLTAREPRRRAKTEEIEPRMASKPGLVKGLLKFNKLQLLGHEPDEHAAMKDTSHAALLDATADIQGSAPNSQVQLAYQDGPVRTMSGLSLPERMEAVSRQYMPRKAFGLADLSPQQAQARLECLQSNFRLSSKEIKASFDHAFQWLVLPELETDSPNICEAAQKFQQLFKDSNLPSTLRKSQVAGTDEREGFGDMSSQWSLGSAHKAEITSAISLLNFIRWLCGLPKVKVSASKLAVVRTIGKALLPRVKPGEKGYLERSGGLRFGNAPGESRRLSKPAQLAKAVGDLIKEGEPVSVLHGEGSLVNGLQQSLCATHMCYLPAIMVKEKDPATAAWNIAQSVGTVNVDEEAEVESSTRRRFALNGGKQELPGPLKALQVLWDLHPGATNVAALKALAEMRAPAAEKTRNVGTKVGTSRKVRKVPAMDFQEQGEEVKATHFGLDAVWGDRKGALSFRRRLLSPSLKTFAAARYDDTCVLWTGHEPDVDQEFLDPVDTRKTIADWRHVPDWQLADNKLPEAVCFPPPGLVPIELIEGCQMPWTIMPESSLFQPTSTTNVKMWRVQIERRASGELIGATRVEEVPILGFAVDCSSKGEPFCVIFWPNLGNFLQQGEQLEVLLSGLCGSKPEITVFHELMSFRRRASDRYLVAEASHLRTFYGKVGCLWTTVAPRLESQEPRLALGNHEDRKPDPIEIEALSHKELEFTATSCDLVVCVRCNHAHALMGELVVRRFAGETTEVQRGAQTEKLGDNIFLVRVKIPMPRYKYELRFHLATHEEPRSMSLHPFRYVIAAAPSCPTLVRSVEDKMMQKFGFAQLTAETQINGLHLLSPSKYRVSTGQCYFLVFVDVQAALAAARRALPPGAPCQQESEQDKSTKLFSHRLLPPQGSGVTIRDEAPPSEVVHMHEMLRESLGQYTQDSHGDIHLDLVLHNGEHIQRLREHPDLPGLFESMVNVTDLDVSTKIQLLLRFPHVHAIDFSPRTVAEWLVCRADEPVPANF
eukprot:gb/GFBE01000687.1/.p1 GENE.gb/GFBE01000687.1/~~gb/GFBE01000687.1/.p1  ORF type:complete len:1096 (+),score=220.61 gb/GFBE01000687.1/:1-3288(+)